MRVLRPVPTSYFLQLGSGSGEERGKRDSSEWWLGALGLKLGDCKNICRIGWLLLKTFQNMRCLTFWIREVLLWGVPMAKSFIIAHCGFIFRRSRLSSLPALGISCLQSKIGLAIPSDMPKWKCVVACLMLRNDECHHLIDVGRFQSCVKRDHVLQRQSISILSKTSWLSRFRVFRSKMTQKSSRSRKCREASCTYHLL